MSFENFERGYLLPKGCKDLTDLFRRKHVTRYALRLTRTRDETVTGALADIGKYVRMAFDSRAALFTLVITPHGERLEVDVECRRSQETWVKFCFPSDPKEEQVVRDFFIRRGLEAPRYATPPSFFQKLPMQLIYCITPLPSGPAAVSELIADLFRQCGKLPDDATLSFHIEEADELITPPSGSSDSPSLPSSPPST